MLLKTALTLQTCGGLGSKDLEEKFGDEVAEKELQDQTAPRNQNKSEPKELKSFTVLFTSTELLGVPI